MHIHILGICGTFMGGIAAIATTLGHKVTGSDANVYPPMSTQLEDLGIELMQGYLPEHLEPAPDLVVVGNACTRGNAAVEYLLNSVIPYTSGPQWLQDNFLFDKWVLAAAGTHGKTSTASMMAWVLEYAGMKPGFLIGGVPQNFDFSARVGDSPFFVIEADEYDSAFFDKRSKFVHYHPRTLVINNMEFDHADIFDSIKDIQKQFHHLVRTVPSNGLILAASETEYIDQTLAQGCWTPIERVGCEVGDWQAKLINPDGSEFEVIYQDEVVGRVSWDLIGLHNVHNALMAIGAARNVGVTPDIAVQALATFKNAKRRMETKGQVNGITVYDDFAHHPTAIATTLAGLREKVGEQKIIAVLEPRSNTMKNGTHKDTLGLSLADANSVHLLEPQNLDWDFSQVAKDCPVACALHQTIENIVDQVVEKAQTNDHILVMSNGGFGGIHQKLLDALTTKEAIKEAAKK